MDTFRKVIKITKGEPAAHGAGVKLVRVIGYSDAENTLLVYIFTGKAIFHLHKSVYNPEDLVDEKQAVLLVMTISFGLRQWIRVYVLFF